MDDGSLETEGATGDLYRVVPDDSFWKISRKQYGSARYYQALMRHNQDRVADAQRLRPGMQLSIPSTTYLERTYPDLIEKSATTAARPASPANATVGIRPRFDRPAADREPTGEPAAPVARGAGEGYFYSKSGEPMYRITVQLQRQSVEAYGQDQTLSPGMLLEADVLLERRRLIEWIFEPLLSLAHRV